MERRHAAKLFAIVDFGELQTDRAFQRLGVPAWGPDTSLGEVIRRSMALVLGESSGQGISDGYIARKGHHPGGKGTVKPMGNSGVFRPAQSA